MASTHSSGEIVRRISRFQEAPMRDKVSEPPPIEFLGFDPKNEVAQRQRMMMLDGHFLQFPSSTSAATAVMMTPAGKRRPLSAQAHLQQQQRTDSPSALESLTRHNMEQAPITGNNNNGGGLRKAGWGIIGWVREALGLGKSRWGNNNNNTADDGSNDSSDKPQPQAWGSERRAEKLKMAGSIQIPINDDVHYDDDPSMTSSSTSNNNTNTNTSSTTTTSSSGRRPLTRSVRKAQSQGSIPPQLAASLAATTNGGSKDRPSREDILASYNQLMATGFFQSHAIQSTRNPPPGSRARNSVGNGNGNGNVNTNKNQTSRIGNTGNNNDGDNEHQPHHQPHHRSAMAAAPESMPTIPSPPSDEKRASSTTTTTSACDESTINDSTSAGSDSKRASIDTSQSSTSEKKRSVSYHRAVSNESKRSSDGESKRASLESRRSSRHSFTLMPPQQRTPSWEMPPISPRAPSPAFRIPSALQVVDDHLASTSSAATSSAASAIPAHIDEPQPRSSFDSLRDTFRRGRKRGRVEEEGVSQANSTPVAQQQLQTPWDLVGPAGLVRRVSKRLRKASGSSLSSVTPVTPTTPTTPTAALVQVSTSSSSQQGKKNKNKNKNSNKKNNNKKNGYKKNKKGKGKGKKTHQAFIASLKSMTTTSDTTTDTTAEPVGITNTNMTTTNTDMGNNAIGIVCSFPEDSDIIMHNADTERSRSPTPPPLPPRPARRPHTISLGATTDSMGALSPTLPSRPPLTHENAVRRRQRSPRPPVSMHNHGRNHWCLPGSASDASSAADEIMAAPPSVPLPLYEDWEVSSSSEAGLLSGQEQQNKEQDQGLMPLGSVSHNANRGGATNVRKSWW